MQLKFLKKYLKQAKQKQTLKSVCQFFFYSMFMLNMHACLYRVKKEIEINLR